MITIKDLDPKKYDPQKLGILKREDNGCGLFLFGSIINRQIRLTLKSEVQSRGETRRTYRRSWWNSESPIDKAGLTKIKAQAQTFYDRVKSTQNNKTLYDFIEPWIDSYQNQRSKNYYRYEITRDYMNVWLQSHNTLIGIEDLQKIDCQICSDDRIANRQKARRRSVLNLFLRYVANRTDGIELHKTLDLFRNVRQKIDVNKRKHIRTISSTDNKELKEKITETFYKVFAYTLTSATVSAKRFKVSFYPLIVLKHFLIPVRPKENESIKRENITDSNLFIEKTKTLDSGFNIPINSAVRFVLDRDYPKWTATRDNANGSYHRVVFAKMKLGTAPHGIRAIFADYMTRENIPFYLVESCLSHVIHNEVANAYHRDAENFFYSQRREVMPKWYNFIFECYRDGLNRFLSWRDNSPDNDRLAKKQNLLPIDLWQEIADKGINAGEK